MKRIALLMMLVLLVASGCLNPVTKVGCCAKANATADGVCVMLNMTTSELMPEYADRTESCDAETGFCNVSMDGVYQSVPFCTDEQLNDCINPECTAMICGDFLFKPKVAPGVIVDDEGLGTTDVPPEDETEDSVLGFYKAQCRFLPMDQQLASIMKNTKSSLNVFRIGVGENFNEFDNYRFYFPISDKYCNINPPLSESDIRIDRYMNYVGVDGSNLNEPYDPTEMEVDCLDDSGEIPPPFKYGELDYLHMFDCQPNDDIIDESDYNFELFCTYVDLLEGSSQYWPAAKRIDRSFYRKALSTAHAEDIYSETTGRAPFECLTSLDCYSATCDSSFYARTVTITESGAEITTDCYPSKDIYGNEILACAPTTNVNLAPAPENPPTFTYASIPSHLAKINVRIQSYPSSAFSKEPEDDDYQDCDDGDNVCELVQQWRDFSGLGLGEHGSTGNLEYDLGEQVISQSFNIRNMPRYYLFENRPTSECELNMLGGSGTVPCPVLGPQAGYPPAGGIVFFGSATDPEKKIYWEGEEIIGYVIGPYASADLYKYMFIDRCAKEYEIDLPPTVAEGADPYDCSATCMFICVDSGVPDLFDGCHDYCYGTGTGEFPCEATGGTIVDPFGEGGRYLERVEIGRPDGETWQRLMDAFEPMLVQNIEDLQSVNWEDGCGGRMESSDVILSSIPWVLDYTRSTDEPSFLSSEAGNALYDYNIYDKASIARRTDLCSLRYDGNRGDERHRDYWMLYADYIYLIKKPSDNTLGACKINSATGMPETKTYGWCEPCTGSTLAFQQVGNLGPYIPSHELLIPHEGTTSGGLLTPQVQLCSGDDDDITCSAPWITDVQELNGDPEKTGSPGTTPIATTLKERLGDYMKSGILPVLDMSGEGNWYKGAYTEYAFEDAYGDMGAAVTIVYTIDMQQHTDEPYIHGLATSTVRDEISRRNGIIKSRCYRCMPAIWIRNIPDAGSLDILLADLFSDPRIRLDIDMVTYDYSPPFKYKLSYQGDDEVKLADASIDYMLSFSDTILQYGKPSIVTGFYVLETSDVFTSENAEILFNRIMERSSDFVDSGAMGLIYMPAKTTLEPFTDTALVDATDGPGVKGEKFCKFEQAVNKFLNPPPSTMFALTNVYETINCTACTDLDQLYGTCTRACANGGECIVPSGESPDSVKCPTGSMVAPCTLCDEVPGTYVCDYDYFNGTIITKSYPSSYISSDLYLDVVAGMEAPDKCCLEAADGTLYSYDKRTYPSSRSLPAVFPASGANISCIGGTFGIGSSFCGQEVIPMKNYDVTCTFIPG